MKLKFRYLNIILIVLLAFFVLQFAAMFVYERNINLDIQQRIDDLVLDSISIAQRAFSKYAESGDESSYIYGTRAFYLLSNLYPETSFYDSNFYGSIHQANIKLLYDEIPGSIQMQYLLEALEILAESPSDITGYTMLEIFANYTNYSDDS